VVHFPWLLSIIVETFLVSMVNVNHCYGTHIDPYVITMLCCYVGKRCVIITMQGLPGKLKFIAKVIELFEADDGVPYCRFRWYYRPEDTVSCHCV